MSVTLSLPIGSNAPDIPLSRNRRNHPSIGGSQRRASWMALAQRGDSKAYRALLEELNPLVVGFLRHRLRDREDLADACQDTFLALHRARHTYQPRRPVEPWLFAIARNIATDYRRRRHRRTRYEVLTDTAPDRPIESEPDFDLRTRLDKALRALPNRQLEALRLLRFQGLSIAEAAARVGTTPAALKTRAHRACLALKAAFRM